MLVKTEDSAVLKCNLPAQLCEEINSYAHQVNAPRSRVVRVALERLFEQDESW